MTNTGECDRHPRLSVLRCRDGNAESRRPSCDCRLAPSFDGPRSRARTWFCRQGPVMIDTWVFCVPVLSPRLSPPDEDRCVDLVDVRAPNAMCNNQMPRAGFEPARGFPQGILRSPQSDGHSRRFRRTPVNTAVSNPLPFPFIRAFWAFRLVSAFVLHGLLHGRSVVSPQPDPIPGHPQRAA